MTHSTRLLSARRLDASESAEALVTALAVLGLNSSCVTPTEQSAAVVPEGIYDLVVWCFPDRHCPGDFVFEWHDEQARRSETKHVRRVAARIAAHVRARLLSASS